MFEENKQEKMMAPSPKPIAAAPTITETRPRLADSPLREEAAPTFAEDIFATTEPVPGGPGGGVPPTVPFEELEERPSLVFPRLIVIVVAAIIVIGVVGWLIYSFLLRPSRPAVTPSPEIPSAPAAPTPVSPGAPVPTPPQPEAALDSDQDRLTEAEEAQAGTDPFNFDTDIDGLTDYEEVKVYKTNPLVPDTDGDGFLDGQEVKGGYDPNQGGGARLLDLNRFINQ